MINELGKQCRPVRPYGRVGLAVVDVSLGDGESLLSIR